MKMKKIALFLAFVMLLGCMAGCTPATDPTEPSTPTTATDPTNAPTDPTNAPTDPTNPPTEPTNPPTDPTNPPTEPTEPTEPQTKFDLTGQYGDYVTNDEADLRQIVVDYMYAMANVQWTATKRLNYASNASSSLIYEPGKTYLGMVYNNNQNGYEAFLEILDSNNNNIDTETGWDTAVGNSCATSIRHAWQQISPTVDFSYSADMLPYYTETNVIAIGDIDWSAYNGKNTNTVVAKHDEQTIFQAYAQTQPGDALVRYLDTGGHALMVTKETKVTYRADGTIDPNNSYVYLTDQNNRLHNRREYPSSWEVDRAVSFASALNDGYLPATVPELQSGKAETPTFELTMVPTVENVQKGTVKGTVRSNYFINTVRMEVLQNGQVVRSAVEHPYTRTSGFSKQGKNLKIAELPAGNYTLLITVEVALGSVTVVNMDFTIGGAKTTATATSYSVAADAVSACAWLDNRQRLLVADVLI